VTGQFLKTRRIDEGFDRKIGVIARNEAAADGAVFTLPFSRKAVLAQNDGGAKSKQ